MTNQWCLNNREGTKTKDMYKRCPKCLTVQIFPIDERARCGNHYCKATLEWVKYEGKDDMYRISEVGMKRDNG